ncbi:MAG: CoA transferase [Pseudomonadota bacterium]|nr:CoA transferase [Pseudomonadota bacterium]
MSLPLDGFTVLDFGQVYNGPYCGFLLAQAGARVIKVESLIGETLRARGERATSSYPFALLNANKESLAINIKSASGQSLIKSLAKEVDVVSENFAPGTMSKYGIGAKDLTAINSRLVYASSTGYGNAEGPYRDYLGMDITLQAVSGVMSVTGEEGGGPLKSAAAFADFIAGTHLYAGIVTALLKRSATGKGSIVDISMQDCVFPTLATALGTYYLNGELPNRAGNRHAGKALAPYNTYEAMDGHIAIICVREGHFRKLCKAMDKEAWMTEPRFDSFETRSANMDELDALINEWTRQYTRQQLLEITQAAGVICAPVNDLNDVVNDPHLIARRTLETTEHRHLGSIQQMHSAIRFTGETPQTLSPAPALGSNTKTILSELLSLEDSDIASLVEEEAILTSD